jgi:hypothetical protein
MKLAAAIALADIPKWLFEAQRPGIGWLRLLPIAQP